ncbi:hypothetical protein Cadr_000005223 [Camelus dromedarius]|uniref:Uncharacterized protein n=1 Tax=Camelus dromedarius TaxID=9838 RepID=A0A5N4E3X9_CAMDR|nr:hypothetical protein Cadr_000005223 [Camelus dromedarius]
MERAYGLKLGQGSSPDSATSQPMFTYKQDKVKALRLKQSLGLTLARVTHLYAPHQRNPGQSLRRPVMRLSEFRALPWPVIREVYGTR